MAYGKGRKRNRSKRRARAGTKRAPKKLYRKKYKVNAGKLLDRRINTAVERRMVQVAKKEAKKLMPSNLLWRRYMFCDYDTMTDVFANPTALDRDGHIVHIVQIPKVDNATQVTVPPSADADIRPTPNYARGTHLIGPMTHVDGYRQGASISIKNIAMNLKFKLTPYANDVDDAQESNHIKIDYAIVAAYRDGTSGLQWTPDVESVLPYRPWGYSSRLDTDIRDDSAIFKTRTLAKGSLRMRASQRNVIERNRKLFLACNKRYDFTEFDQNGQQVASPYKIFFVIRSDSQTTDQQKVTFAACCKVGYQDLA